MTTLERGHSADRTLHSLIERAYAGADGVKGWLAFAQAFEHVLGGARVILCLPYPEHDHPGKIYSPAFSADALRAYTNLSVTGDPFVPDLERLPIGAFESGDALVSSAAIERSEFYREWMEPEGLAPEIGFFGIIDREWKYGTAAILVFRPRSEHCWGLTEKRLGQLLMPHLRRAARIYFQIATLRAEKSALSEVFELLSMGLILLDGRGRAFAKNEAARRLLAARDGLILDRDGLRTDDPEDDRRLRRIVAEVLDPLGPAMKGILLSRPSGRPPLSVVAAPIRKRHEELGPEGPAVFVCVNDPAVDTSPSKQLLSDLYGLTPAEVSLACQLAAGWSLQEAAQHLSIGHGTARNRVNQIFAKTGTSRQASLVRSLLIGAGQLRGES